MLSERDILVIAREVEKQQDTPMHVAWLALAIECARDDSHIDIYNIISWHSILDNVPIGKRNFRSTPAVFNQGMPALKAELIESAMQNLIEAKDDLWPREFVREFLLIHPFSDGNGRVAFILWNALNGTLNKLQSLPELAFN